MTAIANRSSSGFKRLLKPGDANIFIHTPISATARADTICVIGWLRGQVKEIKKQLIRDKHHKLAIKTVGSRINIQLHASLYSSNSYNSK